MTSDKRVSRTGSGLTNRLGQIAGAVPIGISPILRRFWDFTKKMAQLFNKHLAKDREEEFLKVVRKNFEDWN